VVEAVESMLIPGSDKEKDYLEYLLKKHNYKKKINKDDMFADEESS
jgi:hypothetical protein